MYLLANLKHETLQDKRKNILLTQAELHAQSGLASVTGEHYAGGHWLGSFATYYLTQRGLRIDQL